MRCTMAINAGWYHIDTVVVYKEVHLQIYLVARRTFLIFTKGRLLVADFQNLWWYVGTSLYSLVGGGGSTEIFSTFGGLFTEFAETPGGREVLL